MLCSNPSCHRGHHTAGNNANSSARSTYLLDDGVTEFAQVVNPCTGHALLHDALQREVCDLGGLLVLGGDIRVGQVFRWLGFFFGFLNLLSGKQSAVTISCAGVT